MRGRQMFGPRIFDHEGADQKQDRKGLPFVAGGDATSDQKEQMEQCASTIISRVATPEEGKDAQKSVALADLPREQQDVFDRRAPEEISIMSDRIFSLTSGDPITSRYTLDFAEDLVSPLQIIPMEVDYETIANAWDPEGMQGQREESQLTTSPGLQNVFEEWLVAKTPEQASETLPWDTESLGDRLHHLSRADGNRELSSNMRCPSPTPNMQQFQTIREDGGFAAMFGHSSPLSEMD